MSKQFNIGHVFLKKESATILSVVASVGVVGTAVLVGKATPTAIERIEQEKTKKGSDLTRMETIKASYIVYLPAVFAGFSTIACILGANVINKRNQASLASAYMVLSKNFSNYKNSLKELYGEEAHQKVMENIHIEKHNDDHPYAVGGFCSLYGVDALLPETEEVLFYDPVSERYFNATPARVLEAEYHLNRNYTNRGDASLNEFYDFLGLPHTDKSDGLGWAVSDDDEFYWIDFGHVLSKMDGGSLECIVIDYAEWPIPFDEMEDAYFAGYPMRKE